MRESVSISAAAGITHSNLLRYLMAKGWSRRSSPDLRGAVAGGAEAFVRATEGKNSPLIFIPLDPRSVDIHQRIRDAVQVLSEFEERESYNVIESVTRIGYDVLRSAIPTEQVLDDSIPLSAATDFIAEMRGLLAATATTEKRPRPYFGRLLKDGVQFAQACRFGHTYRGSFGFVIESPLPDQALAPLLTDAPPTPFERRVLQRFARGVSKVVEAVALGSTAPVVNSVNQGFSANGCEQFADLIDSVSPAGLKFSVDLSPEWDLDRSMDGMQYIVTAAHSQLCRSAARELRRDDTAVQVNLAGRVVRLQNQTDPTDLNSKTGEHEIAILWSSVDFGDIQVRTNLTPADYLSAVSAHGQGLPVWVSGTLGRVGRQWHLKFPHDFKVPRQGELDFDLEDNAS